MYNARAKREKSYECFLDDLQRCERLGLTFYNFQWVLVLVPPAKNRLYATLPS